MPQNLKNNFNDELFELAEKYCRHNDKELNNCLYYICKPFMEKVVESTRKDMREKFVEVLDILEGKYKGDGLQGSRDFFHQQAILEAKNKIKDI
ncbi:MAG: hypothetical protein AABY22_16280 [Nanoarchaeota archaeon]